MTHKAIWLCIGAAALFLVAKAHANASASQTVNEGVPVNGSDWQEDLWTRLTDKGLSHGAPSGYEPNYRAMFAKAFNS